MVAIRYAKTAAFRELTEVGLRMLAGSAPERRERLAGVHLLYQFLEQELPALWERWEAYLAATDAAATDAGAGEGTSSAAGSTEKGTR
ncbi:MULTISPECIES: hypothetical protein [unclassified Nonomuraea]|uniref:hypothetical protein n=1 Tax=unclassified Nonomuraea TaxID=2593643 RepID=UPI001F37A9DA|nr:MULTISPECIES: hypothetical protein [unclassified Nonomuraea]